MMKDGVTFFIDSIKNNINNEMAIFFNYGE
jgi:hypothetical protein